MNRAVKRPPVAEGWETKAFCKYENPDLWDLDCDEVNPETKKKIWETGRKHCIFDCTVRVECLRKALQAGDTVGVVRGGIAFDTNQQRKKMSRCVLCGYFVAPLKLNDEGKKQPTLCRICRNYAPCLAQCGRLVIRRRYGITYYCRYCSKGRSDG